MAFPPLLVCVVATPFWFLSEFQLLPVWALYPSACSPLLHPTRPNALVVQSANALDENTINVSIIAAIRIETLLYPGFPLRILIGRRGAAAADWVLLRAGHGF
jgi:hypothetical protein